MLHVAQDEDWNLPLVVLGAFVAMAAGYALLAGAMRSARRRRELDDPQGVGS